MTQRQYQQMKTIVFYLAQRQKCFIITLFLTWKQTHGTTIGGVKGSKLQHMQMIPFFFLCKLFLNVWKTETRKSDYTSVLQSNPWFSNSGNIWTLCWLILQGKRTRGILNTRRHTGRHVTKHRLNINMLVPHLCSKYKNTGSSLEINNLPLEIAFLLLLLQIIIKKKT